MTIVVSEKYSLSPSLACTRQGYLCVITVIRLVFTAKQIVVLKGRLQSLDEGTRFVSGADMNPRQATSKCFVNKVDEMCNASFDGPSLNTKSKSDYPTSTRRTVIVFF